MSVEHSSILENIRDLVTKLGGCDRDISFVINRSVEEVREVMGRVKKPAEILEERWPDIKFFYKDLEKRLGYKPYFVEVLVKREMDFEYLNATLIIAKNKEEAEKKAMEKLPKDLEHKIKYTLKIEEVQEISDGVYKITKGIFRRTIEEMLRKKDDYFL